SNFKSPLQHTNGSLVFINDQTSRIDEMHVPVISVRSASAASAVPDGSGIYMVDNLLIICNITIVILQIFHYILHFFISNEGSLYTGRLLISGRIKQHIPFAQQLFRSEEHTSELQSRF